MCFKFYFLFLFKEIGLFVLCSYSLSSSAFRLLFVFKEKLMILHVRLPSRFKGYGCNALMYVSRLQDATEPAACRSEALRHCPNRRSLSCGGLLGPRKAQKGKVVSCFLRFQCFFGSLLLFFAIFQICYT